MVAIDGQNQAVRIDTATNEVAATIPLDGSPTWWGTDGVHLWLSFMQDGTVAPVDPATNTVGEPVYLGGQPLDLAVAGGKAWVPDSESGTLWQLDAGTGEIEAGYELGAGHLRRRGTAWRPVGAQFRRRGRLPTVARLRRGPPRLPVG